MSGVVSALIRCFASAQERDRLARCWSLVSPRMLRFRGSGTGKLSCVLRSLGGGCCQSSTNRNCRLGAMRCRLHRGAGTRVHRRGRRTGSDPLPERAGRRWHWGCGGLDGRWRQPGWDRRAPSGRERGRRGCRNGERSRSDGSVRRRSGRWEAPFMEPLSGFRGLARPPVRSRAWPQQSRRGSSSLNGRRAPHVPAGQFPTRLVSHSRLVALSSR